MGYKQLDFEKRCQIYGLWQAGYNQTRIAHEINVHKSTISRELKRNITFMRTALGCWQYKPNYAQTYAVERHKDKNKRVKLTQAAEVLIRDKLQQQWSPDQISGYARRHRLFSLSHEWIYRYILKDKEKGGKLYLHLRHQHKKYRKRYGSPARASPIKNRVFIDKRPAIVNEKSRIGDWEIDTIIGKNRRQAIVTIVERLSKKMVCKKMPSRKAEITKEATINALKPFANKVLTITGDNGVEFAGHEAISKALDAKFYFAHPYFSWERGLNENTNGLIRQYVKKGSDFTSVSDDDMAVIMDKLNNRPRKLLNYATPNEIFNNQLS